MGAFRYVDIFATKGIEYLLVIAFLLSFVAFWTMLSRPAGVSANLRLPFAADLAASQWFSLADSLYYHQGHSWVRPEAEDLVRVGMDDFAHKLVGRPKQIRLPRVGDKVAQGERGWQLAADSKTIDMLTPVSGEVVAVNQKVVSHPELVGKDPYERDWLLEIKPTRLRKDLTNLLSGGVAAAWMEETVKELRRFASGPAGAVLQDGGLPVDGIARNLSPERWDEIAMDFFLTR